VAGGLPLGERGGGEVHWLGLRTKDGGELGAAVGRGGHMAGNKKEKVVHGREEAEKGADRVASPSSLKNYNTTSSGLQSNKGKNSP